jgi:hypothetical protein
VTTPINPQVFLQQILQIQHMEHGSLCVTGQGPNGPYYNLNSWEEGKNRCRYVPLQQVPAVQAAIEGYQQYQKLTHQYAQAVIDQTRAELNIGIKRKRPPNRVNPSQPASPRPKARRSSS